jgi:hypothetical protein
MEQLLSRTTKRRSLESFYAAPSPTKSVKAESMFNVISSALIFRVVSFFRLKKPSITIVLTDGTPPCRIAVLVGKLAGAPSLLLLHSGMVGLNYECPNFVVDKIAVSGDFARRILEKCGVKEDKLFVTGRPSYDALVRATERFSKDQICHRLGLNPSKKIIIYTTENLPGRENEIMARAINRAVKKFPEAQLLIKVHPSEPGLSLYTSLSKEYGLNALVTREAPIYEVLFICDVIVTGFSATALDGMILDKPVVTVNLTGMEDPIPYAESGAALGVYKEKGLEEAIGRALYSDETKRKLQEARESFVFDQSFKKDGKATERVVELIERMVETSGSAG